METGYMYVRVKVCVSIMSKYVIFCVECSICMMYMMYESDVLKFMCNKSYINVCNEIKTKGVKICIFFLASPVQYCYTTFYRCQHLIVVYLNHCCLCHLESLTISIMIRLVSLQRTCMSCML